MTTVVNYAMKYAHGHRGALLAACSVSITGSGTIATALGSIDAVVANVVNAGSLSTTASAEMAYITAVSAGNASVAVLNHRTTVTATQATVAASGSAKTVNALAVGHALTY
jgi:predicted RNA-binding protein with EMAP domain